MLRRSESLTVSAESDGTVSVGWDFMEDVIRVFCSVEVKDRTRRLRKYKNCFLGCDAVDLLMSSGWVDTRIDAVKVGRILQKRYQLFFHIGRKFMFEDDHLFYRFNKESEWVQEMRKGSTGNAKETGLCKGLVPSRNSISSRRCSATVTLSAHSLNTENLDLVRVLRALREVETRDRRHHLKTYKKSFLGSEAVDVLMAKGCARTREEATQIGRYVAERYNLFEHVYQKHAFEDGFHFYRFTKQIPTRTM